jgi:hypothetical protein
MASPGSEWGSVWEAFARQKVRNTPGPTYLSCAHETLAVDLAIGYTAITGRMQAVMLHTGVGLLQGALGVDAAQRQGIPMVVIAGEVSPPGLDARQESRIEPAIADDLEPGLEPLWVVGAARGDHRDRPRGVDHAGSSRTSAMGFRAWNRPRSSRPMPEIAQVASWV